MLISLDKKDRKILAELDLNSKQGLSSLSKKLKIPIETIRYRINKLFESGVIKNYLVVIDGGKLGFYYYKIFFKFYNVNEKNIQDIITNLIKNPKVTWIIRTEGSYDISLTINVTSPTELGTFLDGFRSEYFEYLHSWKCSVNIQMDLLSRDYLINKQRNVKNLGTYYARNEPLKIDKLSTDIINLLGIDPENTAVGIAEKLGFSSDTILNRIKKLEKDQVIVRYNLVIDNELIGQVNHYLLIYLSKVSEGRRLEFFKYCLKHKSVVYIIKSVGEWDYELNVESSSLNEYRELLLEMTKLFSDIIRDYNSLVVRKIHKYIYP